MATAEAGAPQAGGRYRSKQAFIRLRLRRGQGLPERGRRSSQWLRAYATFATGEAELIDGKGWAAKIRGEIAESIQRRQSHGLRAPSLAVVLVGEREDSATYVRMKKRACEEVGVRSIEETLPAESTQDEIEGVVQRLAEDGDVDGILVQLPLPEHVDERKVLDLVPPEKDVDGFHPLNIGSLALSNRDPLFEPCTPSGCMELLRREEVEVSGKRVAILGRSNIVGMPLSLMFQRDDATVTVLHSKSPEVPSEIARSDILVAAIGKPEYVPANWLKPGCIVVDVGINPVPDDSKKRGYRLVGDVHRNDAMGVASKITPVPGGVGPMTIAMLLRNSLLAVERSQPLYSS